MNDCQHCGAPPSYFEQLGHGWVFCNGCARCYQFDADGRVKTSADTNHAPQRKKVEKDVSGNICTDP